MAVELVVITAMQMTVLKGIEMGGGPGQKIPVMGDDDMGLGQPLEDISQAIPGGRVQIVGRLVKQEQSRLHGKDSGQGHQFFFSAGKPVGDSLFKADETELLQGLNGNIPGLFRREAKIKRTEGHVFQHRWRKKLIIGMLKKKSHLPAQESELLFTAHFPALKKNMTALRGQQPDHNLKKGGLTAAIGADEPDPFTRDLKVKIMEDRVAGQGIAVADIRELNEWS